MSKELSPKYNPAEVEAGRYQKWLDEDVFKPSGDQKAKPYSIVIPPPNVTGKLHLGHAWDTTLQDIIIRQKRMQGFDTLWLPGMDHAGIATQAKVEARLAEDGISRYDLGREKFLDKVWEWKDEYASTIKQQWGKMGLSVDYSRERFTLDEGLSKAVRKVFVELYKKGWIYRGEFIINWDPKARTALSDIEVIHKDVEGAFYHMNYMLEDGSRALEVATTRPETMFGDTAVAVNPNDDRYKDLIGKNVILPILNKPIPIVGDEHADPEFGTGVVKITPAHDPNDFLVGQRHNLPQVNVMNDDGTMNELAGEFNGMDRFEARKAVVKKLEEIGALVEIEKMTHSVGHSERTGVPVEPRLSTQWFVKMDQLAKNAIANQDTDDKVDFYPPRFNDTFLQWMENVHDWVISRQLWWGHQIPAWYNAEGEMYVGEEAPGGDGWKQDEDVLDTWFSSALWPFSTMGWPDVEAEDFKRYFPTSTLVTGYDIIFFWVSRMIFQSLEFTGRQPFKNVLIHGLIRDEQGRKMSKSLGNGIDPMDVIEKYGADALRWFLSNGSAPGQDVRFSYEKMDASWNFINKIWNISRYILMNNEGLTLEQATANVEKVVNKEAGNVTDRWILHNLNETIGKVTENFDKFEFGVAGHILYNFIWDEFADWYVELTKEVLYSDNEDEKVITRSVLLYTLDQILRLLHPIMPFVTEEIYGQISEGTIVTAEYPVVRPEFENEEAAAGVEALKDVIRSVRNSRAEVNVAPSKPITILIKTSDSKLDAFFNDNVNYIKRFTNPEHLEIAADVEVPDLVMSSIITGAEIYLPLADLLNVEEELARLEKELAKWQKELDMVGKKLSNERFVANAKPEVVQKERDKQEDYQAKYGGEFLAELKAKYPEMFKVNMISTGKPIDDSVKLKQWKAEYFNGTNVLERGVGYVLSDEATGKYFTVTKDGNFIPLQLTGKEKVVTGFSSDGKGITYFGTSGTQAKSAFVTFNGNTYYFDARGHMVTNGEYSPNGKDVYRFLPNGIMLSNAFYVDANGNTYLYNYKGQMYKGGYTKFDVTETDKDGKESKVVKFRYFTNEGVMAKGVTVIDGFTQYFGEDGFQAKDKLVTFKGKTYYFDAHTGNAIKNTWRNIDGKWYHFDANGVAATGAQVINGQKLYFNEDGSQVKGGVVKNADGTYSKYKEGSGELVTNEFFTTDGNVWYYAGANGKTVTGAQVINGQHLYFNADGSQVKGGVVKNADGTYSKYDAATGERLTNEFFTTGDNNWYYVGSNGKTVTGEVKIGDDTYYFAKDGKQVKGQTVSAGNGRISYYYGDSGKRAVSTWVEIQPGVYVYFDKNGLAYPPRVLN